MSSTHFQNRNCTQHDLSEGLIHTLESMGMELFILFGVMLWVSVKSLETISIAIDAMELNCMNWIAQIITCFIFFSFCGFVAGGGAAMSDEWLQSVKSRKRLKYTHIYIFHLFQKQYLSSPVIYLNKENLKRHLKPAHRHWLYHYTGQKKSSIKLLAWFRQNI